MDAILSEHDFSLFTTADLQAVSIAMQCSGADPSASRKPCRNALQFHVARFRMARRRV